MSSNFEPNYFIKSNKSITVILINERHVVSCNFCFFLFKPSVNLFQTVSHHFRLRKDSHGKFETKEFFSQIPSNVQLLIRQTNKHLRLPFPPVLDSLFKSNKFENL